MSASSVIVGRIGVAWGSALKKEFVCIEPSGRFAEPARSRLAASMARWHRRCYGEPVLEVEDIVGCAFELVGPDMRGGTALDELAGDAQPVRRAPDAALQDIADAEFSGDLADVEALPL